MSAINYDYIIKVKNKHYEQVLSYLLRQTINFNPVLPVLMNNKYVYFMVKATDNDIEKLKSNLSFCKAKITTVQKALKGGV